MATGKWGDPSSLLGSNIASTTLNSLAAGSSANIAYDNSSGLYIHARLWVVLGSINPTANGNITIRSYQRRSSADEDMSTDLELCGSRIITSGSGVKTFAIAMVRLYPFTMGFRVTNNLSVNLASSGNSFFVDPYPESIA